MRIALVDDRACERQELRDMLTRYFSERCAQTDYEEFPSGEAFLAAFSPGKYALAFLDIYMDGINGMDAARQVFRSDPHCRLVFFTTSHTHAVESYDVRAAFYLTKPVSYGKLCEALELVCTEILREHRYLPVRVGQTETPLLYQNILYVDSSARRTCIHMDSHCLTVDNPIGSILEQLEQDDRFLSSNRNLLVNMDWIQQPEADGFRLKNGDYVPIRQRGKSEVKKQYLDYSLRKEGHT